MLSGGILNITTEIVPLVPTYLWTLDLLVILFSISKDCKLDSVNRDDFSTPADDEGKERLRQKEEEKEHR